MKRFILLVALCICLGGFSMVSAADYLIQPEDVLSFTVWGHEDMEIKELVVRTDGKVSIPLVGELQASGLSLGELSDEITRRLTENLIDPKVTLNIVKMRTLRVYVLGEVNKPGLYELGKQHNLLDAVSSAEGYTKDAAKKKVFVIHKDQLNKPLEVNLYNLLYKGDMSQNIELNDGDVVFLGNNGRIDIGRDILPWLSSFYDLKHM